MSPTERHANQTPLVSVVVTTYNQQDYVEECLRGIAAQQTDFPFEVFVGDDCSTDATQEVLHRIEPELPDYIHILYRDHNLGDKGNNNSNDLIARCTGTYLAACEGDDFWTYPGKLQAQVDFMRSHPDFSAVYHHCQVVGADSQPNGESYPGCFKDEYTYDEFFLCSMPGQTATMLVLREPYMAAKELWNELKDFEGYADDRRNPFLLLGIGRVRCLQQTWSAYRHITTAGDSYSSQLRIDEDYARAEMGYAQTLIRYATHIGKPEALRCARQTYYRLLLKWSVGKVAPFELGASLREVLAQKDGALLLLGVPRWYITLALRMLRGHAVTL